jgi:GNAT superfamily N-acetyltransferase
MWVWDENSALIGISAANGDTGWIWALFVRPEHEGRGIGQALFAAACDALIAAGFPHLAAQHRSRHARGALLSRGGLAGSGAHAGRRADLRARRPAGLTRALRIRLEFSTIHLG